MLECAAARLHGPGPVSPHLVKLARWVVGAAAAAARRADDEDDLSPATADAIDALTARTDAQRALVAATDGCSP